MFEAGEYDRAVKLLGAASELLMGWGRVRESLQLLLPFLAQPIQRRMTGNLVGQLIGTVGNAYAVLGETHRAIDLYEQQLTISRETDDRIGEGNALGSLGLAYAQPRRNASCD